MARVDLASRQGQPNLLQAPLFLGHGVSGRNSWPPRLPTRTQSAIGPVLCVDSRLNQQLAAVLLY